MGRIALQASPIRDTRRIILAFYVLFLVSYLYAQATRVTGIPIPGEYDEHHHVSYVLAMAQDPELFPRFEDLRLVDLGDPRRFTDRANFLPHPSFYYVLLSPLAGDGDISAIFTGLRIVNLALSTAALTLLFAAGYFWLGSPREHLLFGLVGVLNPPLAALGGQVTNDNLALLGGTIAILGLLRLTRGVITPGNAAIIGAGFAAAALSKLTAGLLVGLLVVVVHCWMWRAFRALDPSRRTYLLVLVGLMAVGTIPYLHNLLVYHAPLHVDPTLIGTTPHRLGFIGFLQWFAQALPLTWSIFPPATGVQMLTLSLILILAGFGAWRGLGDGDRRSQAVIVVSCALACATVLPIHFAFSYWQHVQTGANGGAHIRFYLPLWGGVMVGVALGIAALRSEALRAAAMLSLAMLLIYSSLVSGKQNRVLDLLGQICLPLANCGTG